MSLSIWIWMSWFFVAVLTAINIFIFLKLKQASEQMLQMAFPGAKDMNEAMGKMQQMMKGMNLSGLGAMGGLGNMGGRPGVGPGLSMGSKNGPQSDAQLKAAMDMLQKLQKSGKR